MAMRVLLITILTISRMKEDPFKISKMRFTVLLAMTKPIKIDQHINLILRNISMRLKKVITSKVKKRTRQSQQTTLKFSNSRQRIVTSTSTIAEGSLKITQMRVENRNKVVITKNKTDSS
jgi:hypothetical protein